MNTHDISNLNYKELHDLRVDISLRMNEVRAAGITQLRATIAEQASLLGVDLNDLVSKKSRKRRKAPGEPNLGN